MAGRTINQGGDDPEKDGLSDSCEEPFHRQASRHGHDHEIYDRPDLLEQAHEQPKERAVARTIAGRETRPDNDKGRGAEKLRKKHPRDTMIHLHE